MWYKVEGDSQDGGAVISAEEGGGASIIWEEDSMLAPYSITFGIYGLGFHTVRYTNREDAYKGYVAMKQEYQNFIEDLELKCNGDAKAETDGICEWFTVFADKYPSDGSGPPTDTNSYTTNTVWEFVTTEEDGDIKTGYFQRKGELGDQD